MIFEGVNFNEVAVKGMSAEDFESMHIDVLWKDRDMATRKKMLGEVYRLIVRPKREKKQPEPEE